MTAGHLAASLVDVEPGRQLAGLAEQLSDRPNQAAA
jgi:hypothetical protein